MAKPEGDNKTAVPGDPPPPGPHVPSPSVVPDKKPFKEKILGQIVIASAVIVLSSVVGTGCFLLYSWARNNYWRDPRIVNLQQIVDDHHKKLFVLKCIVDEGKVNDTGKYCQVPGKTGDWYEPPKFEETGKPLPVKDNHPLSSAEE